METKIIGNKIAEARKKINISQAELAKRIFISPQAVGKWERGESLPDIITCHRLAEILGVDLNYFAGNSPSTATEKTSNESSLKDEQELPSDKPKSKPSWDMSRGNWVDADFSGLKNLNDKFSNSNMQRCKFIGSQLSGLLLKNNNIDSCDFSNSVINNSQIQGSNLANNQFNNCSLEEAEFTGCHVGNCNFSGADFTGAIIKSGGFEKSIMTNAIWNRTSFNASYLADIIFESRVEDCSFDNCAFSRVIFQNATLINTFFKCRSLKKIKFIDCKADRLTYEFLKNGKADLNGVTLIVE